MEKDKLTQLWNSQEDQSDLSNANVIINTANNQRNTQFVSIGIMSVTVLILVIYAAIYIHSYWNNFTIGLVLMISSLSFRILLEFLSLYRKENQLVSLDHKAFQKYLKKHYKRRLRINYIITPLCYAIYLYGFILLLPYFKREFSESFYLYIVISGIVSLFIIALFILNTIRKELKYLNQLNQN